MFCVMQHVIFVGIKIRFATPIAAGEEALRLAVCWLVRKARCTSD
jgi:hypothetical protein